MHNVLENLVVLLELCLGQVESVLDMVSDRLHRAHVHLQGQLVEVLEIERVVWVFLVLAGLFEWDGKFLDEPERRSRVRVRLRAREGKSG